MRIKAAIYLFKELVQTMSFVAISLFIAIPVKV